MEVSDWSTPLPSGHYRYVLGGEDAPLEREFSVDANDPPWAPELRPLAPAVERDLVSIAEGVAPGGPAALGGKAVEFAAYRITRSPVTWGHFLAAFTEEELMPLRTAELAEAWPPDHAAAAVVPYVFAREYAARVGARLPSPLEVWTAAQGTAIDVDESLEFEWTSTSFHKRLDQAFCIGIKYLISGNEDSIYWDLAPCHGESTKQLTGFRLARSGAL